MLTGGVCALLLATDIPALAATAFAALLSLVYELTQPLLAGIVTQVPAAPEQAMGFNVCALFTGFGLRSLVFQALLPLGLSNSLVCFGVSAFLGATIAVRAFRTEVSPVQAPC